MRKVRSVDGDTLEIIMDREYGYQSAELLDLMLHAQTNEVLQSSHMMLKTGTTIFIPDDPKSGTTKQLERIQNHWD